MWTKIRKQFAYLKIMNKYIDYSINKKNSEYLKSLKLKIENLRESLKRLMKSY